MAINENKTNAPELAGINPLNNMGLENLPHAHIKKINLNRVDVNTGYAGNFSVAVNWKVDVVVCIYDYLEEFDVAQGLPPEQARSYWLNSPLVQKYLNTRCLLVVGKSGCADELILGSRNIHEIGDNFNPKLDFIGQVWESEDMTWYEYKEQNPSLSGAELVGNKVELTFSFNAITTDQGVVNQEGEYIYVFAQNYIDLQSLPGEFGSLDFDYTTHKHYLGPLRGELVVKEGKPVKETNIFYIDVEKEFPWPGAVQTRSDAQAEKYYSGSFRNAVETFLYRQKTDNTKTTYIETATANIEAATTTPGPEMSLDYFDWVETVFDAKQDMDERGNYEAIVGVDYANLALLNDLVAQTLFQVNRPRFSELIALPSMIIIDQIAATKASTYSFESINRLGSRIDSEVDPDADEELLCATHQKGKKILSKTRLKTINGKSIDIEKRKLKKTDINKNSTDYNNFSESDLNQATEESSISPIESLSDNTLKFFHITDDTTGTAAGKYCKYGLQIDFTCNLRNVIKESFHKLEKIISELQAYYTIASMTAYYDYSENRYYDDFMISMHEEMGISLSPVDGGFQTLYNPDSVISNSLWFRACRIYQENHKFVSNTSSVEITNRIFESLNMVSGSPYKILQAIEMMQALYMEMDRLYDLQSDESLGFSASKKKKRPGKNTVSGKTNFRFKTHFKKTMFVGGPQKIGTHFIKPKRKGKRRTKLSKKALRARALAEKNKFFKSKPQVKRSKASTNLLRDEQLLSDIDVNSFSYFTPESIVIAGEEKTLLSTNTDIFDPDYFDDLVLLKDSIVSKEHSRSISDNVSANFSNALSRSGIDIDVPARTSLKRKVNQKGPLIEAREYLGDESTFLLFKKDQSTFFAPDSNTKTSKYKSFVSPFVKKKRKRPMARNLKLADFNPSEKNSRISKFFGTGKSTNRIKNLPLQIKALALGDNNSLRFPLAKVGFDPLENPQTSEAIQQNFLNIQVLKYLAGFESKDGLRLLSKPVYREVNAEQVNSRGTRLCQLEPFEDPDLGITKPENDLPVFNSVFLLEDE